MSAESKESLNASFSSNESVGDPDDFAAFLKGESNGLSKESKTRENANEENAVASKNIADTENSNNKSLLNGPNPNEPQYFSSLNNKSNGCDEESELLENENDENVEKKLPSLNIADEEDANEENLLNGLNPNETQYWEVSDNEHFNLLDSKQLEILKQNCPQVEKIEANAIHCTACDKQLFAKLGGVVRHPLLAVAICKNCKYFYENGIGWDQEEDGTDIYCRWCGNGGELIVCDNCLKGFCTRCLQRNLGRSKIGDIRWAKKWICIDCEPEDIYKQKCIYYGVHQYNLRNVENQNQAEKAANARKETRGNVEKGRHYPTFIDKTIGDSLEIVKRYQKQLEEQHEKWLKHDQKLNKDTATMFTNSLRGLHKNLKRKVNAIDNAIVKSYATVYPETVSRVQNVKERRNLNNPKPKKSKSMEVKSKKEKLMTSQIKKSFANPPKVVVQKLMPERIKIKNVRKLQTPKSGKLSAVKTSGKNLKSVKKPVLANGKIETNKTKGKPQSKSRNKISKNLFQKKAKEDKKGGSESEIDVEN